MYGALLPQGLQAMRVQSLPAPEIPVPGWPFWRWSYELPSRRA